MRILPLLFLFAALSNAPAAAQTALRFSFFADTYNTDPSQGLWVVYPDLGYYSRFNYSDGYRDLAADARHVNMFKLDVDRFQNQTLYGGPIDWDLPNLWLGCIGEGRDGFIYADSGNTFYQLNPATHTYVILGTNGPGVSDMAADVDGTLYGVSGDQLLRIDTVTGVRTLVSTLTTAVNAFAISHDGRFWGIQTRNGGWFGITSNHLYQLDPVTGNATYNMQLPDCEFWNSPGMASELGPPQPMNSVLLSGPGSATTGAVVAFNISAAPLNSSFVLLGSKTQGLPFYGGQPFDLGEPISRVAIGRTDLLGAAGVNLMVPRGLSGQTVYLEAGIHARGTSPVRIYDSNVHALMVF